MREVDIAIIGGGPAGLRAAECAAKKGRSVVVFEGKKSIGRKFLVAGKGGLNLTHGEAFKTFTQRYSGGNAWDEMLSDFSPEKLRSWCKNLGHETFQASSGRVYPKALKGAPILRAWIQRLKDLGVEFEVNQKWCGLSHGIHHFESGLSVHCKAAVMAFGGASWPKTGSDGSWVSAFREMGIFVTDLQSSNCGWEYDWVDSVLEKAEGLPIKNIRARASADWVNGELLITKYGLEGGIAYALGRELRAAEEPVLHIDFKPTFTCEELIAKSGEKKFSFEKASKIWRLGEAARAILKTPAYTNFQEMAHGLKNFELYLKKTRPIAEVISSAGGIAWEELTSNLMLKKYPGTFACGEMIDWDAPTGGYLLQGCFATGTRAGNAAADYLS